MKRSKFMSQSYNRNTHYLYVPSESISPQKMSVFAKATVWEINQEIEDRWQLQFDETQERVQKNIKDVIEEIKKQRGRSDVFILRNAAWVVRQNITKFKKEMTINIIGSWEICNDSEIMGMAQKIEHLEFKQLKDLTK